METKYPNIKKLVSQICIGYSEDFKQTFYKAEAVTTDGLPVTVWSVTRELPSGLRSLGQWTTVEPHVARPNSPLYITGPELSGHLSDQAIASFQAQMEEAVAKIANEED